MNTASCTQALSNNMRLDGTSDRSNPKLGYHMEGTQFILKQNNGDKLERNILSGMAHSVTSFQLLPCPDVVGANSMPFRQVRPLLVSTSDTINCNLFVPCGRPFCMAHQQASRDPGLCPFHCSLRPHCSITDSVVVVEPQASCRT